jgi:hypothetical protein
MNTRRNSKASRRAQGQSRTALARLLRARITTMPQTSSAMAGDSGLNATTQSAESLARAALAPPLRAAAAVADWAHAFGAGAIDVATLNDGLLEQCQRLIKGSNRDSECMLLSQAVALESIFYNLAHQAAVNAGSGFVDAAERYLKLAMRAQSQSRASLETLAFIRNPRSIAFVRQANIASNQQVNNGRRSDVPRARTIKRRPNELLAEVTDGKVDARTPSAIPRVDTPMEAVGTIHRPTDTGRQGDRVAKRVQGRPAARAPARAAATAPADRSSEN